MKLKQRIFTAAIVVSLLPSIPIFASTWTKVLGAGKVVALKSGNVHNTRYDATSSNRSGCANTLAEASSYSKSSCAYLKSTNTSITDVSPAPGFGHYHVYQTFNGMQPQPSLSELWIVWDVSNFPKEY